MELLYETASFLFDIEVNDQEGDKEALHWKYRFETIMSIKL